jgi:hypothetical protein
MKIGWSRSKVNNYMLLLKEIDTPILELAKKHQTGRVSKNDTGVSIDFTEYWFSWSRIKVANYSRLLKNINSPQIFKLAKEYHISNGEKIPHMEN